MVTIFIRTLLTYGLLLGLMRIMGKRQLGELELSDLITTLLLSEIATLPVEAPDLPLAFSVLPIVTIFSLEIFFSYILIHFPRFKNLVSVRPAYLIQKGRINFAELRRCRISFDELLSELRQNQAPDPNDVYYAILEQNGKLSIILKADQQTATAADLNLAPTEHGIAHILVSDGRPDLHNLAALGYDLPWLRAYLDSRSTRLEDTLLLLADDSGKLTFVPRKAAVPGKEK